MAGYPQVRWQRGEGGAKLQVALPLCCLPSRAVWNIDSWERDVLASDIREMKGLAKIVSTEELQNSGSKNEAAIKTFVCLARHGRRALGRRLIVTPRLPA